MENGMNVQFDQNERLMQPKIARDENVENMFEKKIICFDLIGFYFGLRFKLHFRDKKYSHQKSFR